MHPSDGRALKLVVIIIAALLVDGGGYSFGEHAVGLVLANP